MAPADPIAIVLPVSVGTNCTSTHSSVFPDAVTTFPFTGTRSVGLSPFEPQPTAVRNADRSVPVAGASGGYAVLVDRNVNHGPRA